MRTMLHALGILAVAYGGLVLLLYAFQSHLVFYPGTGRDLIATPAQVGLSYEDLHLETADGISLQSWFIPALRPRGTVLFFHGNAGNISHRLDSVEMFHRMGYNMLIFDYRGYGNSNGMTTEQGTYRDADAAWRYLTEQRQTPSCSIVLYGESLGGAIAAWLAGRHRPAALVIASGFTSVPDLARHFYPFLPVRWFTRINYDTREYLQSVSAPVLVAHSLEDEIIPFEQGRALFAAANPPKQFLELAGGHNDGFIFMRESWVKALGDFLSRQIDADCNNT